MSDGTYLSIFVPKRYNAEVGDIIENFGGINYFISSVTSSTDFYDDVGVCPLENKENISYFSDKNLVENFLESFDWKNVR